MVSKGFLHANSISGTISLIGGIFSYIYMAYINKNVVRNGMHKL